MSNDANLSNESSKNLCKNYKYTDGEPFKIDFLDFDFVKERENDPNNASGMIEVALTEVGSINMNNVELLVGTLDKAFPEITPEEREKIDEEAEKKGGLASKKGGVPTFKKNELERQKTVEREQ